MGSAAPVVPAMEAPTPARSLSLLLVGTTLCNLACTYCYIEDATRVRLTAEMFVEIYDKLDAYFEPDVEFIIVFHGGEPLLLGKQFYRRAFDYLAQQPRTIRTAIQSNLTLLTSDWIDLFQAAGCQIGTSVDGTEAMHDANRIHKNGRGSHRDVLARIKDVIDRDYVCSAITTLNRQNIQDPQALYEGFREYGTSAVFFSLVYNSDDSGKSMPAPGEMGATLNSLFDRWIADPVPVNLAFFGEMIRAVLDRPGSRTCRWAPDCTEYFLAIQPDGKVYPCCDFVGRDAFSYGNIFEQDFAEIWDGSVRRALAGRHTTLVTEDRCGTCEIESLCHGGCMAKARDPRSGRDYYCSDYQIVYAHVREVVTGLLNAGARAAPEAQSGSLRQTRPAP